LREQRTAMGQTQSEPEPASHEDAEPFPGSSEGKAYTPVTEEVDWWKPEAPSSATSFKALYEGPSSHLSLPGVGQHSTVICGVGLKLAALSEGRIVVDSVLPASPAARSMRLHAGDEIFAVDGLFITSQPLHIAISALFG